MKLCEVIALTNGKKSRCKKELTDVYHKFQKPTLFDGLHRKYRPKDEEGEQLPSEAKRVQYTVRDGLHHVSGVLVDVMSMVLAQDMGNTVAASDVIVDGNVVMANVPVTHLLYLEKMLVDIATVIDAIPTLDPAEKWEYSEESDCYASAPYETVRTKKVMRNHVKAEATEHHPAQVETYTEDTPVGYWATTKFSGSIPAHEKNMMLERLRKLQDAVKVSRERANGLSLSDVDSGPSKQLVEFILGK